MKAKKLNGNTVLLIITIALFFVMYAVGCVIYSNKGFTHLQTFLNILINNAGLLCITCGMTCVMLTGGIDISVGSLVAMDCMILAVGMERWNMNAVLLDIDKAHRRLHQEVHLLEQGFVMRQQGFDISQDFTRLLQLPTR